MGERLVCDAVILAVKSSEAFQQTTKAQSTRYESHLVKAPWNKQEASDLPV
jgi:phosphoribosyl-AMP cyclohydrolase